MNQPTEVWILVRHKSRYRRPEEIIIYKHVYATRSSAMKAKYRLGWGWHVKKVKLAKLLANGEPVSVILS